MNLEKNHIAHLITPRTISLYINGEEYAVNSENINFDLIKVAILENDYKRAVRLMNPNEVINELGNESLKIVDNKIVYKGDPLHPELERRVIEIVQGGHNLDAYLKFMENLYNNPSRNSREQLYEFISHRGMNITEDGLVIGYKGVSDTYMDIHSGTYSNKVGITNEMPRRDVDDDPGNSCSYGFHIGSKEYADNWAGQEGHLMAVVWNPTDAVSVPSHSNGEKLRVCKYSVVSEINDRKAYLDSPIYKLTDNGLESVEGDGIIEQQHSDDYYKAHSYIETARDNGRLVLTYNELDNRWDLTEEDWDNLTFDCAITPDEHNDEMFHL